MTKPSFILIALILFSPVVAPVTGADLTGAREPKRISVAFKSNQTMNIAFKSGSIENLPADFENQKTPQVRRYAYATHSTYGTLVIDLRDVAAVMVEQEN
jgi:hypothetical protein